MFASSGFAGLGSGACSAPGFAGCLTGCDCFGSVGIVVLGGTGGPSPADAAGGRVVSLVQPLTGWPGQCLMKMDRQHRPL